MCQVIDSEVGHLGISLKWGNNEFHACSLQCLQHISRSASVLQVSQNNTLQKHWCGAAWLQWDVHMEQACLLLAQSEPRTIQALRSNY